MASPPTQTPKGPDELTLPEIHASLDIPDHRVELIGGRIIVSPSPIVLHGQIVFWLGDMLRDVCADNGWTRLPQTTLELLATEERIVPDLLIYSDDGSISRQWMIPAEGAVLVVEVVSYSSQQDDYKTKRQGCAASGIPVYLIIDPFTSKLTLCTEPSDDGYRKIHTVDAGAKLDIPAPIDFTLDTSTMPAHRPAE